MRFIQSSPNEYLVTGRRGRLKSRGVGASAMIWPGSTWVRIPTGKHEACFAMTQETQDGIPLRFKGEAIHRVIDPVAAAMAFDFGSGAGLEQVRTLIEHVCLAELRDRVSHMTMAACIEERKTTLSQAVDAALAEVMERAAAAGSGWGIAIDVVQVSQVFIVDAALRQELEAERRGEIERRSTEARIRTQEEIQRAQLASERRLQEERLERDREQSRTAREAVALERDLAADKQASEAALARARVEQDREALTLEQDLAKARQTGHAELERERLALREASADLALPVRKKEVALRRLEVERDMLLERAQGQLEQELLPLRQLPEIAAALAQVYQGATVSIYGADHALSHTFAPLVEGLAQHIDMREKSRAS